RVRASGCVLAVVVAAFALGGCAREDAPAANWRTSTQPPMSFAPSAEPAAGIQTPGSGAPMAPSMQTLPQAPLPPAERNPCLTKWGSPRLDAPDGCAARSPRAELAPSKPVTRLASASGARVMRKRGVYKVG